MEKNNNSLDRIKMEIQAYESEYVRSKVSTYDSRYSGPKIRERS
jgi:hypothetical protein